MKKDTVSLSSTNEKKTFKSNEVKMIKCASTFKIVYWRKLHSLMLNSIKLNSITLCQLLKQATAPSLNQAAQKP